MKTRFYCIIGIVIIAYFCVGCINVKSTEDKTEDVIETVACDEVQPAEINDTLPNMTNSWGNEANVDWIIEHLHSDSIPEFDLSLYQLTKMDEDSVKVLLTNAWYDELSCFEMGYIRKHYDSWKYLWRICHISNTNERMYVICMDVILKMYLEYKHPDLKDDGTLEYINTLQQIITDEMSLAGDGGNIGMMFANSLDRNWKCYLLWKKGEMYRNVLLDSGVNYAKECVMMGNVMACLLNCYDSIGHVIGGSGAWMHYAYNDSEQLHFREILMNMCIGEKEITETKEIPMTIFDEEFKSLIEHHDPITEFYEENYKITPIVKRYKTALKKWLQYRNKTANKLKDSRLKTNYINHTNSFIRQQLIHVKNRFYDSMGNDYWGKRLLPQDCTEELLMKYFYEQYPSII